ncbi:GNAT family N-acetyltransferase [Cognatilysobacter lacus]|uniref:GNAT family N-acetyltransferase n=1 Tax=Cognatilysobacter lacus TaxID=1643323 RepID=A0A5D8Z6X7_9GAMM|nr:GNAT family N-acetyltransferase [Lysobacter lacus]TZF90286.1 GNAT family N-acetyltransferase [Lysobacter lacus]
MLRDASISDYPRILELNRDSVAVLSPLDALRLARLHGQAHALRVAERDGRVDAFLLTLREGADYDSENYRWFDARYAEFVYVDRVVVHAAARGAGLGRALYDELFARACADGVGLVCCEFDIDPPNAASARFHARHGFREDGRQMLASGKVVSMQVAVVP